MLGCQIAHSPVLLLLHTLLLSPHLARIGHRCQAVQHTLSDASGSLADSRGSCIGSFRDAFGSITWLSYRLNWPILFHIMSLWLGLACVVEGMYTFIHLSTISCGNLYNQYGSFSVVRKKGGRREGRFAQLLLIFAKNSHLADLQASHTFYTVCTL